MIAIYVRIKNSIRILKIDECLLFIFILLKGVPFYRDTVYIYLFIFPFSDFIRLHGEFKICSLMRYCVTSSASHYAKVCCIPVSAIPSCSSLWSLARGHLVVPWTRASMAFELGVLLLWAHPTGTSYLSP